MRLLVTGGAGFIGSHLSERLSDEGHEVVVVDDFAAGSHRVPILEKRGIDVRQADIRSMEFGSLVSEIRPGAIFHLAAQASVPASVKDPIYDAEVNVIGLIRVLESARAAGARVVFAASGGTIYGEPTDDQMPITEETIGLPSSPYGITKKSAEYYLRVYADAHGVNFVSLALGNVYGPRQDPRGEGLVIAVFASRLLRGEPCFIYGDGEQTRDFVYVSDVVDAFVAALGKGHNETINIGSGQETKINDLFSKMIEVGGFDAKPTYKPPRPGDLLRNCLSRAKAERILGWTPVTGLDDGLKQTIEFFRETLSS